MPWDSRAGMFTMSQSVIRPPGGYGTANPTNVHGTSAQSQALRYLKGSLLPAERPAEQYADRRRGAYEGALDDIGGTIDQFGDIYRKAGEAIAAPAQRDYQQHAARVGANAASRFGGNVSSEELRQGYNTGDLFSRNLSEAMARLGGEQVGAGLNYTGQLGSAASQSAEERDRLRQMILQGIGYGNKPKKKGLGGTLKDIGSFVTSAADAVIPG